MNVKDSIRKRLNKSFAMISLVCSIGLVICGISLFVISSQYHNALTNYGFAQGDIGKAMVTFSEARSSLRAVIGYTDMNEIADEQKNYETKKSAFEGYMADVEKTIVTKAGKDAYAQVESALNGYWTKADSILKQGATTDNGASGAAQKKEIEELSPMYDNVYAALKNIMDINVTKGDEVQNTLNVLMYILIVLVVAIIAFSVYMSTHLGRRIADNIEKPVEALAERLKKFAAGDLDSEFPESEIDDEIAYMNNVAKEMAADLNLIISDLSRLMDEMAEETAVITAGLVVSGDLDSVGSIDVFGTVEGNVACCGKLTVSGTIEGAIMANEVFANNAKISGDIQSKGSAKIGQGTVVIGNITATSAVIAGAVKGNVDINGPVVIDSSAVIVGDIKSKSVQINNGATIDGRCSQCYADVDTSSIFDIKAVGKHNKDEIKSSVNKETAGLDSKSADSKSVNDRAVDGKEADSKSANDRAVDGKAADNMSADNSTAGSRPAN